MISSAKSKSRVRVVRLARPVEVAKGVRCVSGIAHSCPSPVDEAYESYCLSMATSIATLRRSRGLSQRHLGRIIGCSQGYIAKVENMTKIPSTDVLFRIAYELGTTYYALVNGDHLPK